MADRLEIQISAKIDSPENRTRIQKEIDAMSKNLSGMSIKVTADSSQMRGATKDLDKYALMSDTARKRGIAFFKTNSQAAKAYGEQWRQVQQMFAQANDAKSYQSANRELQNLMTTVRAEGKMGATLFDGLRRDTKKFVGWLTASGGVMMVVKMLKDTISAVKDLDKAVVDLQMATGYNKGQAKELLKTYAELGQQVGATTREVAESASSWLRQGMSVEDTNTMIKNSMMLSKVGLIESGQATEYLTAIMKGHNITAKESIQIVDKLSKVDLEAAVSAGGIAEALSRTSTSARLAGVDLDRLIGYLTVVGETTQREMSTVGESFKTIFARMRDIKIGKDLDDEGESLSDVETTLKRVGITLRDSTDSFRNFGVVLDEVGGRWNTFSDVEQASIAKALAGTRNQENLLVLMDKYGTALEYSEVAMNSAGTATEKMDSYLGGLEASTKTYKASFEEMASAIMDSGLIKWFVDFGTGANKAVTGLVETFGSLGSLAAVGAGIAGIKYGGKRKKLNSFVLRCKWVITKNAA